MKHIRLFMLALLLLSFMLIPARPTAAIPECATIEVGGHVANNCVWKDYWTCCDGYCFAWSRAEYCA